MARYIQLIGLLHSGGDPVVIEGPSYDVAAMKARYKQDFAGERVHPKFERVEYLDSVAGMRKHKNFITPAEAKRREKELKKAELTEPPSPASEKTEQPPKQPPEDPPKDE
jgi:hypothetical protein